MEQIGCILLGIILIASVTFLVLLMVQLFHLLKDD